MNNFFIDYLFIPRAPLRFTLGYRALAPTELLPLPGLLKEDVLKTIDLKLGPWPYSLDP